MAEMMFFGNIAFDGGNNGPLESRQTHAANLVVIADWFDSVIDHYKGEFRYNPDCKWFEIRVDVYVDEPKTFTVEAEPILSRVLRSPYQA